MKENKKKFDIAVIIEDLRFPIYSIDTNYILELKKTLSKINNYQFHVYDDHSLLLKRLLENPPQFVFNLCDEGYKNNDSFTSHIPRYLELLNIPYSGPGPICLDIASDKSLVRALAFQMDIPVPKEIFIDHRDIDMISLPTWGYPVIVKPNYADGSVGITKNALINSESQLKDYILFFKENYPNNEFLIQEYLSGPEYTVGVMGNIPNLQILPILEIDYSSYPFSVPILYDEVKRKGVKYWKKANLTCAVQKQLEQYITKLFKYLHCFDFARFDFRTSSNGQIHLLEVNAFPAWGPGDDMYYMAALEGLSYSDFLKKLLNTGLKRYAFF